MPWKSTRKSCRASASGTVWGLAGDVNLDPIAGREDHELVAGERPGQGVEPPGVLGPVEGQGLADGGGRGAVVDPQSEQPHGTLPAVLDGAVGRGELRASTPTQANTRKAKATIVRTITLRPRIAGRNRAWSRHREHQPHPQGADDLGIGPAEREPRPSATPRAFTLSTMPIRSPNVSRGNAIVIAPRLTRSLLLEARQRQPEPRRLLGLESPHLGQVHEPGGERHAGEDGAGQQEDAVDRAPEGASGRPSSQSDSRGANQPAATTRPRTSGSTNRPTATFRGQWTIRYRPIRATIQDSDHQRLEGRGHRQDVGPLIARLARKAVWTAQPRAVSPTARYQRNGLRTTSRASSRAGPGRKFRRNRGLSSGPWRRRCRRPPGSTRLRGVGQAYRSGTPSL